MRTTIPALLSGLVIISALGQPRPQSILSLPDEPPKPLTNSIALTWDGTTNISDYVVWCGQSSRQYTTNWTTHSTNISVLCTSLYPGTNYFAVTARQISVDGKEAVVSDFSEEVKIIRRQSFPVWIKTEIQTKTNIQGAWIPGRTFYLFAVNDPKSTELYRSKMGIEVVEQDDLLVEF